MVYIFRRVGGRKVPLRRSGELAGRFLAKRYLRAHEYCVYSWWRTGWMVEHWRDFFFKFSSESHSFQRLTITWASWRRGILVYQGFYLIWRYVRGSLLTFPIDTAELAKNRRHVTRPCVTEPCYRNSSWIRGQSWWGCLYPVIWVRVPSSGSGMRTCPGGSWGRDSSNTVHSWTMLTMLVLGEIGV